MMILLGFLCLLLLGDAVVPDQAPDLLTEFVTPLSQPSLCHLRLVCSLSKWNTSSLTGTLLGLQSLVKTFPDVSHVAQIQLAMDLGSGGGDCNDLAPACVHDEEELLDTAKEILWEDIQDQEVREKRSTNRGRERSRRIFNRRRLRDRQSQSGGFLSRMPPIFTPDAAAFRQVCRACDRRRTACTVFSVGTFAGCNGMLLVAGPGGQLACNMVTAPGSIGCGINSLHCFMSDCGLIHIPNIPNINL